MCAAQGTGLAQLEKMKFFLNGAELSLNSAYSGKLIISEA